MKFQIEVLSVSTETKQSSGGKPYVMLDVAFKNLTSGKTEGKKFVPFGDSEAVYHVLKDAKNGNVFDVTMVKGEKYWQWTEVIAKAPGAASLPEGVAAKVYQQTPKSTYETPEERAKKQVYIVKQSSISNALTALSIGAKTPPTAQSVIDLAQVFTSWVLSSQAPESLAEMQNDSFDDVPV